jgi:hypothetical protein
MPKTTAEQSRLRPTLGEFFGAAAFGDRVEKKLFGGPQVSMGFLVMSVSPWMFEVGCILGRALRDRIPTLVKIIGMTADGPDPERKVSDVLCRLAVERMERYGGRPASLYDFWLKTEFRFALSNMSMENLKSICLQRIPLEEVLSEHKPDEWLAWGIGFGATYPQVFEELWAEMYETVDKEMWAIARHYGVAVPEHPTPLPLKDMEEDILADTAIYTQKNFPELLDSLDLRERLSYAK